MGFVLESPEGVDVERPLARPNADDRRRIIIDRAARLFERNGFEGTSMQDIADEVGLAKGAIYHYIRSKQELLYEVHNTFIEDMLEKALGYDGKIVDPSEKLRCFIRDILETVARYGPYVRVFFQEMKSLEPAQMLEIGSKRNRYTKLVERCIEAGIATGAFRAELDPRLSALFIFGACNWTYQWYRVDGGLKPEELTAVFYAMVMEGCAGAGGV